MMNLVSSAAVAGTTRLGFLTEYFDLTSVMNVHEFFSMMETEIVDGMADAEIVVTDKLVDVKEGTEVIRSCDTERILALMTDKTSIKQCRRIRERVRRRREGRQ